MNERSRSPESVITISGITVQLHRNPQVQPFSSRENVCRVQPSFAAALVTVQPSAASASPQALARMRRVVHRRHRWTPAPLVGSRLSSRRLPRRPRSGRRYASSPRPARSTGLGDRRSAGAQVARTVAHSSAVRPRAWPRRVGASAAAVRRNPSSACRVEVMADIVTSAESAGSPVHQSGHRGRAAQDVAPFIMHRLPSACAAVRPSLAAKCTTRWSRRPGG